MPPNPPPDSWADKHVPFYKSSERAWNKLLKVHAITCAVPGFVYMEAAIAGLFRIAYNIASPDPKEVYHQVIGNSLYHDIKNATTSNKILKPLDESKLTRTLFKLADAIDIGAWYIFIAGSVTDGLVDFSSHVLRFNGCATPHSPAFHQGGPYINAIGDDGNFWGDDFAGNTGDGTPFAGPMAFSAFNGHGGFCAGSCMFATFGGGMRVPTSTATIRQRDGAIMDIGHSKENDDGKWNMGHTFYKIPRNMIIREDYEVMSSCGQSGLPLHEAFRDGDNWYGFCLNLG